MSENRTGIWPSTGGRLSKDRTIFRFGKRVESVCIKNSTSAKVTADIQVARDPRFYLDVGHGPHANRKEVYQETYFYMDVPAGSTAFSPPFFADRGLKIKRLTAACWGGAIVHGVQPGDVEHKDRS